jgi:hypothetical protein
LAIALDTALEVISIVFLSGGLLYGYRLSKLTKGAEIVALAKPKTFFASILISFASLLALELVTILSEFFFTLPEMQIIWRVLIIATALSGVFGLYTAVYYYRTSPRRKLAVSQ